MILTAEDLDGLTVSQVREKKKAGWELDPSAKSVFNAARDELGDFIGRFVETVYAAMEGLNGGPFPEEFGQELDMVLAAIIAPVAFTIEDKIPIRVPVGGLSSRPPHFMEIGDNAAFMGTLTEPFIRAATAQFRQIGTEFLQELPIYFSQYSLNGKTVMETRDFKLLDYSGV